MILLMPYVTNYTLNNVTYFLKMYSWCSWMFLDKSDGSFSRSRSSSMSSLENISKESIQCLTFADAYTRKTGKSLWIPNELNGIRMTR